MANIFLDANDTFTLPSTNTDDKIFGRAAGNETIILQGNPSGTVLDGNIEVVQVASSAANTTLQVNATTGLLELVSGSTVFATFSGGLNGPVNLQFTDGNVTLTQTGANSFSIANPTNATNNVTISSTTSQTGSAVTLGPDQSTAGPTPTTPGAFTVTTSDAAEGSTATFTVTRDGDTSAAATVDYAVSLAGGATAADHGTITAGGTVSTTGSGTLSFAAGEASKTITIPVTADIVTPEAGEGITVTLTNPTGGTTLGTAAATSTILDDPSIGTLTQNATSVTEGQTATYTLTLKAPATTDTVVSFTVAPGDASAANQGTNNTNLNDFAQGSFNPQTVTIAAGSTTATFALDTTDDNITELPENYTVSASIGGNTVGTVTTSLLDSGGAQGQTFTLTAGADNVPGTAGNDVILGANGTTDTLTTPDIINGGVGTDTFNITLDGTGAGAGAVPAATISNVENFFVRNVTDAGTTVNFATITGEAQAWNDRSTQAVTFNGLGTGTTVGVKGDGASNVSATNFAMQTATDAVSIAIDAGVKGGNAITNTGNGPALATIASTGAANTVGGIVLSGGATVTMTTINAAADLTSTGITGHKADASMTISGAASKVSIGTLEAAVDTVNASGLTAGGVTLVMDAEVDTTVTGGAGSDVITTGAALTTGSVNAGAGTDTLIVANSAHVATATLGGKYTNFETLQANDGTAVDLDNIAGITAIKINDGAGTTAVTDLTATQAGAITAVAGNAAGAITIGVKGAATVGQIDTVKITADDGATTTSMVDLGTPVIADVEKLELTAVDNITVAALTSAESLDSIKLMGAGTQSITSGTITPEANTVVDGSAATGALTINFGGVVGAATTNATSFIGGTKGDTITTTGGAADLVNGKGGIDSITVTKDGASSGFATVQSEATTSADADLITGFVTGENKFDYNGTLSNGTGTAPGISAAEVTTATNAATALASGGAANDIVFIATDNLVDGGGTQSSAIDAAVAGGMTAAEADAIEAALVGTDGALSGEIANLDTVLGTTDSVLFAFDNGTNSVVVRVTNTDTSAANTLTDAEVEVVGVFAGTAALATGDFV